MFLMASCGSSETQTTEVAEDTFGMEIPVEALESEVPYEGTGNMSDNGESVSETVSEAVTEEVTEESATDKVKEKMKEVMKIVGR